MIEMIEFNAANYLYLLILLPIIPLIYLKFREERQSILSKKKIAIMILRIFLVLFLILALSQPIINTYTRKQSVVFLADRSISMRKYNVDNLEFIKNSLLKKKEEDKYGVISFAEEQKMEKNFVDEDDFNSFQSQLNSNFTNIESVLKKALSLLSSEKKSKVILLSDGEENIGEAESIINDYQQNDISIYTYNIERKETPEVYVENLILPKKINPDTSFELKAYINSNINQAGILRIYHNDNLIYEKNKEFKKGNNKYSFTLNFSQGGYHNLRVELEADKDFYKMNNILEEFIFVRGESNILLLNNERETHNKFINSLNQNDFNIDQIESRFFSYNLNELEKYDAVIMENVSAENLNLRQMKNLISYVSDSGGGLLFLGGDNSYGAGNYANSPLETISPLSSEVKSEVYFPSISIVIALDKSDSMKEIQNPAGNLTKLDLAKEATIGVIDFLVKDEKLGVVGFDNSATVLSPLEKINDKYLLFERFSRIKANGGTNIYNGLQESYDLLLNDDSSIKHIILISDGKTTSADFDIMLNKINENKITLTTVAVGKEADEILMKELAEKGKGKYYYADTVNSLPGIFAAEAKRITNPAIINKETQVKANPNLNEITTININNIPSINKYNATSQQKTADVLMVSEDEFPLLAIWRYGLGRVAAFSGDSGQEFSEKWLGWSEYDKFWSDMLKWIKRPSESNFISPQIIKKENKLLFQVNAINNQGEYINYLEMNGIINGPGDYNNNFKLEQTGSGLYEKEIAIPGPGSYLINFYFEDNNGQLQQKTEAYVLSYSPEYLPVSGEKTIESLVKETGGSFLESPEDIFANRPLVISGQKSIWPYLVIIALILFLLEIALRIISFDLLKRLILSYINRVKYFINRIREESEF